jgi:predicted phage tail protein
MEKSSMTTLSIQEYIRQISDWKQQGMDADQVTEKLKETAMSESQLTEILEAWKKETNRRKQNSGLIFCGIGAAMLLSSFLITFILYETDHNFSFVLYGLTLAGICLLMKGVADFLGF